MNKLAVEELVKKVRQRIAEGDCPTTPALTVEMLENLVDHLASPVAPPESARPSVEAILEEWAGGGAYGERSLFIREWSKEALLYIASLKLASPVAGGSARIAEIVSRLAAWNTTGMVEGGLHKIYKDCNWLLDLVRGQPEGWVKVTPETMPPERERVLADYENHGVEISSWFQWETMEEPLWAPGIREWGRVRRWHKLPVPAAEEERSSL